MLKYCLYLKRLIYKGRTEELSDENVWDMDDENSCKTLADQFELEWNKAVSEKYYSAIKFFK